MDSLEIFWDCFMARNANPVLDADNPLEHIMMLSSVKIPLSPKFRADVSLWRSFQTQVNGSIQSHTNKKTKWQIQMDPKLIWGGGRQAESQVFTFPPLKALCTYKDIQYFFLCLDLTKWVMEYQLKTQKDVINWSSMCWKQKDIFSPWSRDLNVISERRHLNVLVDIQTRFWKCRRAPEKPLCLKYMK